MKWRYRGGRHYELSNHLGNVQVVVTDKKIAHSSGGVDWAYYTADVLSAHDQYAFGYEIEERGFERTDNQYRYGFNGKEKSDEIASNDYDFGARIYDGRLGRFLGVDPLAKKFTDESPFIFVSNSPLMHVDIDGKEKIVVAGGADLYNSSTGNFVEASKIQLQNYLKLAKVTKEVVTWMVFDLDYTDAQRANMKNFAKKNGVKLIYVQNTDQLVNYINSKDVNSKESLSEARKEDQISNVSFFAHGTPGRAAFGYENYTDEGANGKKIDIEHIGNTDLDIPKAKKFTKNAFTSGAEFDLFTCNASVPENMKKLDFKTTDEMKNAADKQPNLTKAISQSTGATTTGLIGQSTYKPIDKNKLPAPGVTGGNYSPTVKGNSETPSVTVKYKNGKKISK
jgi:RHS repeat-associated protein